MFHVFSENQISECYEEFKESHERWEELGRSMSKNKVYDLLNKKLDG